MSTYRGGQRTARNTPQAVNLSQFVNRALPTYGDTTRKWFGSLFGGQAGPYDAWLNAPAKGKPGGNQPRNNLLSPAPGAPSGDGREYVSEFAGHRDAAFNRARQIVPTGAVWSPAGSQSASALPASMGGSVVTGASAARNLRERQNEMLQNAGVQQPLPPMEDLRPYWAQNPEIEKAAAEGPRSGEVGYSDRADIREWMQAMNKTESGRAMVNRFLEQQQRRGLIREQPESVDSYTPVFTQRQLADVDAVQSPAFSKGRDQILAMRDPMVTPPNVNQSWSAGFQKGDPVDWEAAMGASLAVPGGPAAQRREDLNRVLDMPGALVSESPSADQRWAAGFTQDSPTNWDAAVNTKLNVPTVMGNAMQPGTTLTTSQPSSNVNWNAAMNTDLGYSQGITGNEMELGERFNNPDEQRRRLAAGFLGNRIEGLKRFFPGA